MGITSDKSNIAKVIWFDEEIKNKENQKFFKQLKSIFEHIKGYQLLDEGFENFYLSKNSENNFKIKLVIVSGKLFGRYIKKIKKNINKIINIPYTFIFTSVNFKKVLLKLIPDKEHILSYDTMISVNNGFYNPGGVFDDFDELLNEMKIIKEKIISNIKIEPRIKDKINYEGLLTFEYLDSEEDLLAPALYKDIITNEKITQEDCNKFHKYILSFKDDELNSLIKNLELFKYIPFEILSKYWARFYTIESDFYKVLNNNLMKSKMPFNYKTFIKLLYKGVEINSFPSYLGKYLYRGSSINKVEIDKIKKYKNNGKLSNVVVFSKAFLSFSEDKESAKEFLGESDNKKIGCLYILENNNINLHQSNANIQNFSIFPNEKEIIFFPGSSFIIKNIKYIEDNQIEILLNYNGKFKEKYSLIYENQEKINYLIYNNELTKNIAGKELCFLKNGKYLKEKLIIRGKYGEFVKGKDLETEEIVSIKQFSKREIHEEIVNKYLDDKKIIKEEIEHKYENLVWQANLLKKISNKIKYSCKFKDFFETENDFYLIMTYYDDNLENYHLKKNEKTLFPNQIKKIFKQLNEVFKELLNNHIVHRNINPQTILIKYNNEEETNFDSILTDDRYSQEYEEVDEFLFKKEIGALCYTAPEILKGNKYKNNCDLYSIGVTIYYLYFGKYPFFAESPIDLLNIITKGNLNLKIEEDKKLEDLLIKLLNENPDKRISWKEYFEHSFFKQYEY